MNRDNEVISKKEQFMHYLSKKFISSGIYWITSVFLFIPLNVYAQSPTEISTTPCNTPLVGPGRVIDKTSGGLINLLPDGNMNTLGNLLDGNLSNFVTFSTTASIGSTPIVSIKDVRHFYKEGLRTGFVIQQESSLLSISLLTTFQIRTYKDNVLQETSGIGGAAALELDSLNTSSSSKKRISFVTKKAFDEVELVKTNILSLLSATKVYHAFVGPAISCNYNCITPVTASNGFQPSIVKARTGKIGTCLLCSVTVSDTAFVSDNDLNNHASMVLSGVDANAAISVATGKKVLPVETFPGHLPIWKKY